MGSGVLRAVIGLVVVGGAVGARVWLKPPRDPVIHVDGEDARMVAAEKEARARWPEFLASFKQRQRGTFYAVKYGFPVKGSQGGQEFIWLEVKTIGGGTITGVIDNEPNADVGYKLGDTANVPEKEISDWIISSKNGEYLGGFQVKVLKAIERERGK